MLSLLKPEYEVNPVLQYHCDSDEAEAIGIKILQLETLSTENSSVDALSISDSFKSKLPPFCPEMKKIYVSSLVTKRRSGNTTLVFFSEDNVPLMEVSVLKKKLAKANICLKGTTHFIFMAGYYKGTMQLYSSGADCHHLFSIVLSVENSLILCKYLQEPEQPKTLPGEMLVSLVYMNRRLYIKPKGRYRVTDYGITVPCLLTKHKSLLS